MADLGARAGTGRHSWGVRRTFLGDHALRLGLLLPARQIRVGKLRRAFCRHASHLSLFLRRNLYVAWLRRHLPDWSAAHRVRNRDTERIVADWLVGFVHPRVHGTLLANWHEFKMNPPL